MQFEVRRPVPGVPTCFLVFFLCLFACLGSCAVQRFPQPTPSPPTPLPSAQDLLRALDARRQALTGLRGLARVVYKDTQEKGSAKHAVAASAPDRFRLELFSPIGIAALITSNGQTLSAYFPAEKVIYRGAATPLNVARFTRIMLSSREIVGLLLGLPVLPPGSGTGTVRLDEDRNWYRLECPEPSGGAHVLWFEPNTLRLRRAEMLAADGTVVRRADLNEYREVNHQVFPFEIVLSDLQGQQEAAIYYEQIEFNPHTADSLFTLAPVAGVQEIDADSFNP